MIIQKYFKNISLVPFLLSAVCITSVTFAKEEPVTHAKLKEKFQALNKDSKDWNAFATPNLENKILLSNKNAYLKQNNHRVDNILNDSAFKNAMKSTLPLSKEQILALRRQFNETQSALAVHPDAAPKAVIASRSISLTPGSTPMVVRLAQGYVTTLAFVDATGQPWPIESYTIGDPQSFNVQWDQKGNLMMIQAITLFNMGNLAVKLQGLHVPIMLTLMSGQKSVDYRLDMRIPGEGPYAKPLLGRALPPHTAPELLSMLDGVPPANSTLLNVTGGEAQAWLVNTRLYLRTHITVLSPAWIATLSSADGIKVYELPKTSLVIGVLNGQTIHLKIQGF